MTPVKRLIEYHCARLKDKNRDVRLKAIKELELLGHPDALDALREVFDADDDREVRKAAQNAGRAIFMKANSEE